MNLQAMLDIEDTGKVVELLEQNNWDESVRKLTLRQRQVLSTRSNSTNNSKGSRRTTWINKWLNRWSTNMISPEPLTQSCTVTPSNNFHRPDD